MLNKKITLIISQEGFFTLNNTVILNVKNTFWCKDDSLSKHLLLIDTFMTIEEFNLL
ncbi:hypothetical protein RWZ02_12840 [Clostridium butyricum]|uniref:hypothetical protein n=1 Tax=Clostridium butyricum TaxID=1492 RepID=UPI000A970EA3|nr:hypothetical protein [Clostridium butyricum]